MFESVQIIDLLDLLLHISKKKVVILGNAHHKMTTPPPSICCLTTSFILWYGKIITDLKLKFLPSPLPNLN